MNEMLEIAIREIEKVADTKIEQISINVSDYDDETKTLSIDISYHAEEDESPDIFAYVYPIEEDE